jgi:hypothetical protein
VVPEPSSVVLLTIALTMLGGWFTTKR